MCMVDRWVYRYLGQPVKISNNTWMNIVVLWLSRVMNKAYYEMKVRRDKYQTYEGPIRFLCWSIAGMTYVNMGKEWAAHIAKYWLCKGYISATLDVLYYVEQKISFSAIFLIYLSYLDFVSYWYHILKSLLTNESVIKFWIYWATFTKKFINQLTRTMRKEQEQKFQNKTSKVDGQGNRHAEVQR